MSEYPWKEKNNTFTWLSSLYNPFKAFLRGNRGYSIILTHCYIFNEIFIVYRFLHCFVTFTFKRWISVSCLIKMILHEYVNFICFCVQIHLWSQGNTLFFTYWPGKNIYFSHLKVREYQGIFFPKMLWTLS